MVFKYDNIHNTILAVDEELNILMCRT